MSAPAVVSMKARAKAVLRRIGLLPVAYRASSYVKMRREAHRLGHVTRPVLDGLPLPPPDLIYQTAGTVSPIAYVESGRMTAESIRVMLSDNGFRLGDFGALLDFGCGCGRVVRFWANEPAVAVHGSDYNPRLVDWCNRNLAFAEFRRNALEPPLPYGDESFGFVYAISVFTHLPEQLQRAWLKELRRVLLPGGLLLLTTHGRRHFDRYAASPAERRTFADGNVVVGYPEGAGSNLCAAFHPESYVREQLASDWELVDYRPEGDPGTGGQELWLLRRSQD